VSGKPIKRSKHIPQRTCVGCRKVLPKRTMIRLVRREEGVQVDLTGKLTGRGAYLHGHRSCWEISRKGPLAHALKTTLTESDILRINDYFITLPENEDDTGEQG
jgi:predicted RNA-binding protein YlxR (DUF448 family)